MINGFIQVNAATSLCERNRKKPILYLQLCSRQ